MKKNPIIISVILLVLFSCSPVQADEKITHFGMPEIKPDPRTQDKLVSKAEIKSFLFALTDTDFNKRIEAQWRLRLAGDKSISPELIEMLQDKRSYVKQLSCELLGELGDKSCLPHIAKLLEDKDDHVKETAAMTLAAVGDRTVVPALIKALNQPRPVPETIFYWLFPNDIFENFRYAAVEALNKITNSHFYYKRNETNFGRISAQNKINKWWEENRKLFTHDIELLTRLTQTLLEESRDLKSALSGKDCSQITGGEDMARHIDSFDDKTKSLHTIASGLPLNKEKLYPEFHEITELANYIDEIFVYAEALSELKPDWKKIKKSLKEVATCLKNLELDKRS